MSRTGRPPLDFATDPDRHLIVMVDVVRALFGLSTRKSCKLVVALAEGRPIPASMRLRPAPPSWLPTTVELIRQPGLAASIPNRDSALPKKVRDKSCRTAERTALGRAVALTIVGLNTKADKAEIIRLAKLGRAEQYARMVLLPILASKDVSTEPQFKGS